MKRISILLVTFAALTGVVAFTAPASRHTDGKAAPNYGLTIPAGYRDWKFVSVAHEEGELNDIRVILGNDVAIKTYRQDKLPFPDGTIIARIAWKHVPSEENNKVFGRQQSFVPGDAPEWYLQVMFKDSKKFAETGGWAFTQFDKDGKPADAAMLKNCFDCHQKIKERDLVFTHYAQ
jgi:hypothetical protein